MARNCGQALGVKSGPRPTARKQDFSPAATGGEFCHNVRSLEAALSPAKPDETIALAKSWLTAC